MSTKNVVAVLLGLFLLPVAVARAEGPQPGEPGYVDPNQQQYQQQPMGDPNQQQYQQQQQQQQQPVMEEQTSNEQAQQGRGIEYGGYLTVPIFVGPNADAIGLGVGLLGRIGWEFGSGFTAELNIGVQYNSAVLRDSGGVFNGGITNISLGAGLRYSFLNASALVPFLGLGIQANLWGVDYGGGESYNDSLAFGVNALAGLAYELSADLAIEAGLRWDLSTKDSRGFFGAAQSYISPFVGATLYY